MEAVTDLQTAVMLSPPDEKEIITAKLKEAEAASSKGEARVVMLQLLHALQQRKGC